MIPIQEMMKVIKEIPILSISSRYFIDYLETFS